MHKRGLVGFIVGSVVGTAAGVVAGMLTSPKSGAENREAVADAMGDTWDAAVDTYNRGQKVVNDCLESVRPNIDTTTDELRAKVDAARERMDQLRESLSDAVVATGVQVQEAAQSISDQVTSMVGGDAQTPDPVEAEGVCIEKVDEETVCEQDDAAKAETCESASSDEHIVPCNENECSE